MNYYATLGVSNTASQDDIKIAFKKLALEHHPDRGGDEKKFAQISEAYDTLKDVAKRKEYDDPKVFSYNSKTDFDSWLNKEFYYRTGRRNQNIKITYTISFAEQFTGKHTDLSYQLPSGKTKTVSIKIPKGIAQGQNLTFSNLGDNSNPYVESGALILSIKVKSMPNWQREGNDVRTSIKVNVLDLILGTKVSLSTPIGKEFVLNIKPGTKPNTVLSIPEYGIPHLSTGICGNVLVKIEGEVPLITEDAVIDKLKQIRDSM